MIGIHRGHRQWLLFTTFAKWRIKCWPCVEMYLRD